jgi:hypothetical protein
MKLPVKDSIYEYSLYGAILLLSALEVAFYKAGAEDAQVASLHFYTGAIYVGVVAWAFHCLNALYRKRKLPAVVAADQESNAPRESLEDFDGPRERITVYSFRQLPIRRLTLPQLAVVLVVFAAGGEFCPVRSRRQQDTRDDS